MAVAVFEFLGDALALFGVVRGGDAAIGAQPLVFVGDVIGGDADIERQVERGVNFGRHLLALQLAHGFFKHTRVHIEAHGVDMAVLLAAQQVASTPQLEIERRNLEACPKVAELFERGKPFSRDFREFSVGLDQQIRIRAAVRAAHAPAKLIELREPVLIRMLDDHDRCGRNINPHLNNRGSNQNIHLTVDELLHHVILILGLHLSMDQSHPITKHFP